MSTPLPQSAVCPILIGRSEELAALYDLIVDAAAGNNRVVLISGEAGIGKTRLIAEVATFAAHNGMRILRGHCFEQDRAFSYAPLIDLLRSFAAGQSPDRLAYDLGDTASELVKLLPDLATYLDNLSPSPSLNPEQEKQRLFYTLTRLCARLAAATPLLVIIEDLHWSDDTSLEFLLYLARRLTAQPLLLLFSYRTHEVEASLQHFLAELDREHVAVEMVLSPLAREHVDAMVRAIFDLTQPTTREFLDSFYALSEGNPFFVEEILKALIASGAIYFEDGEWARKPIDELQVPRSVQDAVSRRTALLGNDTRRIMTLAAVAGRRFDFSLLQSLTGYNERVLFESFKQMIAAQLVVEESAQRLAFRHALTREVIYSELLAMERIALHGRIAETIEQLYEDSIDARSGELSYHYYEAGIWPKAMAHAKAAGDRAQGLYAHDVALRHYERARDCAQRLDLPERMANIDEAMGDVNLAGGEYLHAADAFLRALENIRSAPERARIKVKLGAAYMWNVDERGQRLLEDALEELNPETQANELASAMVWLARAHWHGMQFTQSIELCEQALQLADRIGDPTTLIWIYRQLASTYSVQLKLDKSIEWARKCVDLGEREAYPLQIHGYAMLAQSLLCMGNWREAFEYADAMHEVADQVGWLLEIAWANLFRCWALYGQGDLDGALATAYTTLTQANEIRESRLIVDVLSFLTLFEAESGNEQAARMHAESAIRRADALQEVSLRSHSRRQLAHVYLLGEEWAEAKALFDECAEILSGAESAFEIIQMGADHAETCLALGRLDEAERIIVDSVHIARRAHADHYEAVVQRVMGQIFAAQTQWTEAAQAFDQAIATLEETGSRLELAHALYQRGTLHQSLGTVDAARADWERACTLYEQTGARPMLWRAYAALGQLAKAQGHAVEADREFAAARAIVEELATGIEDDELRERLLQRAARVIPPERPLTTRQALQREFGGLTAREREVAAMVATGKTNRDIADALVLSERTVEGHVSNILSKLGFTSRTQIAAWAVTIGLVNDSD